MESDNPSQIILLISLSLCKISLCVYVAAGLCVCVCYADMHTVTTLGVLVLVSNLVVMNP